MKTITCILLTISSTLIAQTRAIKGLAGVSIRISNLEKTRQFYAGILGLTEAFDLKDASGNVQRAFFKVNDDQYLEFCSGAQDKFQLQDVSFGVQSLKATAVELQRESVPYEGPIKSPDGSIRLRVEDTDKNELDFVQYVAGSEEGKLRSKDGGAGILRHLQHVGLAPADPVATLVFYRDVLRFPQVFVDGSINEHVTVPGSSDDSVELMTRRTLTVQEREHIAFEVPDIQRTYKRLLDRGLSDSAKPYPSKLHRWILNLKDPNGMRIEIAGEAIAAR